MVTPDWKSDCGRVRLFLGDFRKLDGVASRTDSVLTDPPYGLGDKWNGGAGGSKSSWKIPQCEAKSWDMSTVDGVEKLALHSECVIWGGNYYQLPPSRCWLVWDKCQPDNWTTGQCELAWTNLDRPVRAFRMCQAVAHDQMRPKRHPAQKPSALMSWCLKWISGKCIYDPFMGSGTTGVAAVRDGREFVGVEVSEKYFSIAVDRIKDAIRSDNFLLPKEPEKNMKLGFDDDGR